MSVSPLSINEASYAACYHALSNSAIDAILVVDCEGAIVNWNHGAEVIFGYTEEEAIGMPFFRIVPERDRAEYAARMAKAAAGMPSPPSARRAEGTGLRRDGSEFPVEMSLSSWRDGDQIYFIAMVHDISARRNALERLKLLEAALEASADTVVITDRDGTIRWVNPAFSRTTGYTREEAIGQNPRILKSGAQPQAVYEEMWKTVSGGRPWRGEFVNRRKDGTLFTENATITPVLGPDGAIAQYVAIKQDVSELKEALRKLAEREAHLQFLFESLPVGLSWSAPEGDSGRVVNPEHARITGITAEAARIPGCFDRATHPDDRATHAALSEKADRGEIDQFTVDKRYIRPDGSIAWARLSQRHYRDATGKVAQKLVALVDISETKAKEAELEKAKAELEAKNAALNAALRDARAAAEAKAMFLATMSHEIRTPMNGVIGMASLLGETGPLTDEQRDYLSVIRSSGESLMTIINDVLDFSKIESGGMDLEAAPFDLRSCMEDTLDGLAPLARDKQLDLALEFGEEVPPAVEGDAIRLRQVITNLVGNAIKFTERGEVVVEVRSEACATGGARLKFCVRDTGIGIPADKMDRLFKSFSQVDPTTTRKYGGTGLGLAISQRLVALMGGRIEVASSPGKGSAFSFSIELPVAEAGVVQEASTSRLDLSGRNILIVDDNATNRRIFASQLRLLGCNPIEAADAIAALDRMESGPPVDLVITDMLMPGLDGLSLACAVRRAEALRQVTPPTPIILVSSGGFNPHDPRASEAKLDQHLSKPLRQKQLHLAVTRSLSHLQGRRPSAAPVSTDAHRKMAEEHPCRILLVEDNLVNRKVALSIMARMGYTPDIAEEGAAAVRACQGKEYDLVFMDMQMPVMDGLAATRAIRALPITQPQIVAMTANAFAGDRDACLAAGMDDYIAKPVKPDDLRAAIKATARR